MAVAGSRQPEAIRFSYSGLHLPQRQLASNQNRSVPAAELHSKSKTQRGFRLFRLKVAHTAAEMEKLRSAWDRLDSSGLSMFQSYRWNCLAARLFARREQPYFILAESDSGTAIVPAVIDVQERTLGFAGERLFDYRDYLSLGDNGPLVRAWHHLAALKLPIAITAIRRPKCAAWDRLPKTHFSSAPQLANRGIAAEKFVKAHPRGFSRLRRLQRMGLHIREYPGSSPIVRQIYDLRAQQSGNDELFRDPLRVEFMVEVCREAGNTCEVLALENGSTLTAALVTFRDRDFRRFYTTYYDHRWARYSPGVSLLFEIARRSLEQGLNLDLMTGEQAYKMRLASAAQDLFEVKASAAELRQAFADSLQGDVAA